MFPGTVPMFGNVGGVVSGGGGRGVTVTLKVAEEAFPTVSVALQVTRVVVTGKGDPSGGVQVRVATPSGSVAVTGGLYVTSAPPALVAGTVISGGTVIVGPTRSSTLPLLLVIAEASGVAHMSTIEQTESRTFT
jgi:hypothetical protein